MASKKLKKILKAALVGGLGLAAAKGLGRKSGVVGVRRPGDKSIPGMLGDRGFKIPRVPDRITSPDRPSGPDYGDRMWDLPWGAKGGGIAKRGTGAAFKKGGHVKSMGIAKRGGGAAKR